MILFRKNVNFFRIVQVSPQSYLANLPEHETKKFLLKLSAKWRKRLEEEQPHPGVPERVIVNRESAETSFNEFDRGKQDIVGKNRRTCADEPHDDVDDTDVLTQAARGVAYAYHQAADYVAKSEKEQGQCVVQ